MTDSRQPSKITVDNEKKQIIIEKKVLAFTPISISISILFLLLAGVGMYFLIAYYKLPVESAVIITLAGILGYGIALYIIIRKKQIQEVREIEIPVKEVIVEKPVLRVIEKPAQHTTETKTIIKKVPIYIEKARKKLKIPKYNFRGSTETKTYHKTSCRLSKLIKNKYKLSSIDENYFLKRNFAPCKVCLKQRATQFEKAKKMPKKKLPILVEEKPISIKSITSKKAKRLPRRRTKKVSKKTTRRKTNYSIGKIR